MVTREDEVWHYILCITQQQEHAIRRFFKKQKWNIDIFFRVPPDRCNLMYSAVGKSFPGIERNARKHRSPPYSQEETNARDSTFTVDGAEYREMGIFSELMEHLEVDDHHESRNKTINKSSKYVKKMNRSGNTNYEDDMGGREADMLRKIGKSTVKKDIRCTSRNVGETLVDIDENQTEIQDQSFDLCPKVLSKYSKSDLSKKRKDLSKLWQDAHSELDKAEPVINKNTKETEHFIRSKLEKKEKTLLKHISDKGNKRKVTKINSTNTIEFEGGNGGLKSDHPNIESEDDNADDGPGITDKESENHFSASDFSDTSEKYNKSLELKAKKGNMEWNNIISDSYTLSLEISANKAESDKPFEKPCNYPNWWPVKRNASIANNADRMLKCQNAKQKLVKICEVCGKVTSSEKFYRRHMMIVHSEEAQERKERKKQIEDRAIHACPICHKQFAGKYGVRSHLMHMHSETKVGFQCDLCGAVMKFKGSLVAHMKSVHMDTRLYQCDICNKNFKVLQQMKNHRKRSHDPDYVETCTICGKTVKKGQLTGHLKRHTNDRPHKCSTCEKSFYEKQDLMRHMRIHSGEKPFICPHCPYACAIRGNLTKHIKHKHEGEPDMSGLQQVGYRHYRKHDNKAVNSSENNKYHILNKEEIVKAYAIDRNTGIREDQIDKLRLPGNTANRELNLFPNDAFVSGDVSTVPTYMPLSQAKITYSESLPISGHDLNQSKSHTGCYSDAHSLGLSPVMNEESTLFTMRPVTKSSYTDEQKQYLDEQGGESVPPFRHSYVPHVTDIRYPYNNQNHL